MIYEGMTAEEFRELLLEEGYAALIEKDTSGESFVRSAASGLKFRVLFYGANKPEDRATSVSFVCALGYDKPRQQALDVANAWNQRKRFAALSVDDDDDLGFEWDVPVAGVSDGNMRQVIDRWANLLGEMINHVRSS